MGRFAVGVWVALGLTATFTASAGDLSQPFPAVFQLSTLHSANGGDGSLGFVIEGAAPDDRIGQDVAHAGDVNGDGVDDIIVGSGLDSLIASPFVVLGRHTESAGLFPAELVVSALNGTNGFRLTGIPNGDSYEGGVMVAGAGDLNADGVDDMIVGVPGAGTPNPIYPGRVYVLFGRDAQVVGAFPAGVSLAALNGSNGFIREGFFHSHSGCSVGGGGDLNGDQIDDVVIGAEDSSQPVNAFAGSTVVVAGSSGTFAAQATLSPFTGCFGADEGDESGCSVAIAGDINDDGIDDLIIGASRADAGLGEGYVVFGRTAGFSPAIGLAFLNGATGFRLDGTSGCGTSVSPAGDMNHDGIDDIAVASALGASVVFGRNTAADGAFPSAIDLSTLDGTDGFNMTGISVFPYYAGRVLNTAGDVNGDGIDDLVIGSMRASPGEPAHPGECFVVYGRNVAAMGDFPATIALSSLDGTNGFRLAGISSFDGTGVSASSAGDINADGVDDLVIGAVYASPGGRMRAGKAYVVFGRHAPPACDADTNNDQRIDGRDLSVLLSQYGEGVTPGTGADFNNDGLVNGADLSVLLGSFGQAC